MRKGAWEKGKEQKRCWHNGPLMSRGEKEEEGGEKEEEEEKKDVRRFFLVDIAGEEKKICIDSQKVWKAASFTCPLFAKSGDFIFLFTLVLRFGGLIIILLLSMDLPVLLKRNNLYAE